MRAHGIHISLLFLSHVYSFEHRFTEKFSPRMGPVISDILTPRKGGAQTSLQTDVLSPRTLNSQANLNYTIEPTSVPGLELSHRGNETSRHNATSRSGE